MRVRTSPSEAPGTGRNPHGTGREPVGNRSGGARPRSGSPGGLPPGRGAPGNRWATDSEGNRCPGCGGETWTYCHTCKAYVEDLLQEKESDGEDKLELDVDKNDNRLERELRVSARQIVELRPGWKCWDLEQERAGTSTRQDPGPADWFVCGHGVNAWIEWKRPNGSTKQSEAQLDFERWVTSNGGTYLVLRSEEALLAWLENAERART